MYRQIRILVAEDNEHDAFFLKRAFTKAGINAPMEIVGDGKRAMDYLCGEGEFADRGKFPVPHLVLLDLNMPLMGGFEVLEWVRGNAATASLPIIILSSSDDQRDVDRAHKLGANGYTVKPTGFEELELVVEAIRGFWLGQHRYPSVCGST